MNPVPKPIKKKKVKIKRELKMSVTRMRAIERKLVRKLEKECKELCSMICRKLWNHKCATCEKEGSATHHFFGWKACSNLRFTLDNLVWLCYGCHIGKVHQQGLTEPVREKIIERIGIERFDRLYSKAFVTKIWTSEYLLLVRENLIGFLNLMEKEEKDNELS